MIVQRLKWNQTDWTVVSTAASCDGDGDFYISHSQPSIGLQQENRWTVCIPEIVAAQSLST